MLAGMATDSTLRGIEHTARRVHIADVQEYEDNPREGDVPAIAASLRANGQYAPIIVNAGTLTGRDMEVLAGNHTVKAIRLLGETHPEEPRWRGVDAWIVDVDETAAARIVASDNRTAELGGVDDRALLELIGGMEDLDGTGYDLEEVADLEKLLELAAPKPNNADKGQALADSLDRYENTDARQIVLVYLRPDYDRTVKALDVARARYRVDTYADAVRHMVAEQLGEEPAGGDDREDRA